MTLGASAPSRKIAVYLIFQPRGLAESSLLTCRHLAAGGYAPLVVSNAPLSEADRTQLQAVAWKVVERPNFGYDFGGYRDGVWLLQQWSVQPESLILMNDSIWFPALEGDQTIATMEATPSDFKGVLTLGTGEGAVLRRGREPFLGSFFLMFSAKALASNAFAEFWQRYRNTSNKYKTIRRGERRLSYVMRDAGFEGASLFDRTRFDQWIRNLDVSSLRRLLDELVTLDPVIASTLQVLAKAYDAADTAARAAFRASMLEAISAATNKSNIFSSAPVSMLRDFRLPFVKKARDPWNLRALERLSEYHRKSPGSIRLSAPVGRELGDLVRHL
ncbi:MAG: rhamnan synthesis F family protein [Betaproteobacteria bacterium]